jgi:hypothetical protein
MRFKRQGMSWTKEGANNLLKLRILGYNKTDWEAFWKRRSVAGGEFLPQLNNTTQAIRTLDCAGADIRYIT